VIETQESLRGSSVFCDDKTEGLRDRTITRAVQHAVGADREKRGRSTAGSMAGITIMAIHEILLTVCIVIQMKSGAAIGTGTGFFYTQGDKLFLVTNEHMFLANPKGEKPDSFKVRLHTNINDTTHNDIYDISIYSGSAPLWKTHPRQKADVALIQLNSKTLRQRFVIKAWSKDGFLPSNFPLNPGEDVFIMGYPESFHDQVHNLPVLRNAMIASAYGVPFSNQPLFLTDAKLLPGNSGGPVVTKPKNVWVDDKGNANMMTGTVYYLLGIHSGTVDPKMTQGTDVGLGAAWYISLVEDIALQFP